MQASIQFNFLFKRGLIDINEKRVNKNNKSIQVLQLKSPYGACKATKSRLIFDEYATRIGSIANVNGFIEASQLSHLGIKDNGAKAVLANNKGKFMTKISAISSIWPGRTKAKHRLIEVTNKTNKIKVVKTIPNPKTLGNP